MVFMNASKSLANVGKNMLLSTGTILKEMLCKYIDERLLISVSTNQFREPVTLLYYFLL
jgi:hypothetical protein